MTTERKKKSKQTQQFPSLLSAPNRRKRKVPQEEEFLRAVEAGDVPTLRRLLQSCPQLDVNCTDLLGRTPLRISVQNENEEIVELLLDKGVGMRNMYESLLLAISLDHDLIALIILRHPLYAKYTKNTGNNGRQSIQAAAVGSEDLLFASETTPVILSAQRNRYEVLSLLLKKGDRIEEPHDFNCDCQQCLELKECDELRYAKSRLNAYKGMASEAYICLASTDPIRTAFDMRRKLGVVAVNEKHYRDEYRVLRSRLSVYVVRLLDCVRGDEELDAILNTGEKGQEERLAGLHIALRYNEKKFVGHSSCQKKLTTIWYGSLWKFMSRMPRWGYPLFLLGIALSTPILSIVYLLAPASKVREFVQIPYVKFIAQTTSYFTFLFLVCIFSSLEQPSHLTSNNTVYDSFTTLKPFLKLTPNITQLGYPASQHLRIFAPTPIQIVMLIFIIGMVWQEAKQLYSSSAKEYLASLFNLMDSASLCLYIGSFTLRYISFYKTARSLAYFTQDPAQSLEALRLGTPEALYRYYWLFADRMYWNTMDPLTFAEGLFAVANVISFTRLFYLLAANEQLGPLQISLRRMITDIAKFSVILVIIFVAFMIGLNNLYWYYEPSVQSVVAITDFHENPSTEAGEAFGTYEDTFTTMFWAMFGMGEKTDVKLTGFPWSGCTERIGYNIYGIFNVTLVIIILNMLIAMMSRSFEAIVQEEDIEWKFARTQLYMDFIQPGCTLPVPFNLIPSPKTLFLLATRCCRWCKHHRDTEEYDAFNNTNDVIDTSPKSVKMKDLGGGGEGKGGGMERMPNGRKESTISVTGRQTSNVFEDNDGSHVQVVNGRTPVDIKRSSFSSRSSSYVDNNSDSAVKKIHHLGKKLFVVKEKMQKTRPSYETVMKRVVKRHIFASQQVDNSQVEGEVEDLKQDLAGLRYELNNKLENHQKALVSNMNLLSAKLDILQTVLSTPSSSSHPGHQPSHSDRPPKPAPRRRYVNQLAPGRRSIFQTPVCPQAPTRDEGTPSRDAGTPSREEADGGSEGVQEEPIVPVHVLGTLDHLPVPPDGGRGTIPERGNATFSFSQHQSLVDGGRRFLPGGHDRNERPKGRLLQVDVDTLSVNSVSDRSCVESDATYTSYSDDVADDVADDVSEHDKSGAANTYGAEQANEMNSGYTIADVRGLICAADRTRPNEHNNETYQMRTEGKFNLGFELGEEEEESCSVSEDFVTEDPTSEDLSPRNDDGDWTEDQDGGEGEAEEEPYHRHYHSDTNVGSGAQHFSPPPVPRDRAARCVPVRTSPNSEFKIYDYDGHNEYVVIEPSSAPRAQQRALGSDSASTTEQTTSQHTSYRRSMFR